LHDRQVFWSGADDVPRFVILHDRFGFDSDRACRTACDHVGENMAGGKRAEDSLHHVRYGADGSPVGFAEDTKANQHQRDG
jgi:hypothetical protein